MRYKCWKAEEDEERWNEKYEEERLSTSGKKRYLKTATTPCHSVVPSLEVRRGSTTNLKGLVESVVKTRFENSVRVFETVL